MNLTYSIVWFDDSKTFVDTLKGSIETYLQDLGFSPSIIRKPSGKRSLQAVKQHEPDLILIDLNLAQETKGQDIVDKIRKNELYTDVIFYSQHERLLSQIGRLDGVFYCERADLEEKTRKIIDVTVKREQDVNNLRGVLIAEAIDLERKMECFITRYFGLSRNEEKRSIFERLYTDELTLEQKYEFTNRIFKKAIARMETKLQMAKNNHSPKVGELSVGLINLKTGKQKFDKFSADIIKIRNIMAHVEEVRGQKNMLHVYDKDGKLVIVDDQYCKDKRKNVGEHSRNLQGMIKDVNRLMRT